MKRYQNSMSQLWADMRIVVTLGRQNRANLHFGETISPEKKMTGLGIICRHSLTGLGHRDVDCTLLS
jgi:hypothetical protein